MRFIRRMFPLAVAALLGCAEGSPIFGNSQGAGVGEGGMGQGGAPGRARVIRRSPAGETCARWIAPGPAPEAAAPAVPRSPAT
jgi:hypothetical protein